jgi:hypothetical protein
MREIAASASCSTQYVLKKIKEYRIPPRSRRDARIQAFKKGKISIERVTSDGEKQKIILRPIKVNERFFKTWSPSMAHVLGVIYTDGNLIRPRPRVSQKEPELLNKILKLMSCNAKLRFNERRKSDAGVSGPAYYFA